MATIHSKIEGFDKCVKLSRTKCGLYNFDCVKGLFGTSCYLYGKALREAEYYFSQYKDDGEYHDIIGGEDPITILTRKLDERIKNDKQT